MDDRTKAHEGDDELERRLEAYAGARLSADPERTVRMRAAVMTEARARLAAAASSARMERTRSPFGLLLGSARRAGVVLAGAALALIIVTGSVFAASRAGGPLYGLRLWVETATLPTDANARAQAELDHLQARLDDAVEASTRGDEAAVDAALAAYRSTADEALSGAGADPDRLSNLRTNLIRHDEILAALIARLPAPAQDAIQRIIDRDQHSIDAINAGNPPGGGNGNGGNGGGTPGTPAGGGAGGGGGGNGGSGGGGNGGGKPNPTPKANPTPTPDHTPVGPPETPKPHPTPKNT